jgi:hypothetical protein
MAPQRRPLLGVEQDTRGPLRNEDEPTRLVQLRVIIGLVETHPESLGCYDAGATLHPKGYSHCGTPPLFRCSYLRPNLIVCKPPILQTISFANNQFCKQLILQTTDFANKKNCLSANNPTLPFAMDRMKISIINIIYVNERTRPHPLGPQRSTNILPLSSHHVGHPEREALLRRNLQRRAW